MKERLEKFKNIIPYGRQDVSKEDIKSVIKVLKSDFITQGSVTPEFEREVKTYCGSDYAFAYNSATSALHAACFSLGVKKGDLVWTSANTFVATANCALYCGAEVDFVDINPRTFNISIEALEKKLKNAKKNGSLPKVIIPVHISGQSCEMKEIHDLSKIYKFKIIEDASHAIGGEYKSKKIGQCIYSDIAIFSFHPVKIITTGEGGIAVTNSKKYAEKLNIFRSHGITKDFSKFKVKNEGPWFYEQQFLGFNYRMTDIHASLGLSQLKRIDEIVKKRHEIANFYFEKLTSLPVELPIQSNDTYSSFHLFIIRLKLNKIKLSKKEIFSLLRKNNILVNIHYIPVYFHPFYKSLGFKRGYCPSAEKYYKEAFSLPIFPNLTKKDQLRVIKVLKNILR